MIDVKNMWWDNEDGIDKNIDMYELSNVTLTNDRKTQLTFNIKIRDSMVK